MGSLPAPVKPEYKILEKPSRSGRKLRIVCLGGGSSALNLAHEVSICNTLDLELVCYEKNPSIGETWYENRYPGCGCDIPSVNYQFSWAPSPEWTQFYSSAPEILQYFKDVAEKYDLNKYIHLNHRVVGAFWDEPTQKWNIRVEQQDGTVIEDTADIFVNASGVLNKWKWPAIKGRETFKGKMLHSANWDNSISLEGKRVGVIGSGSSAVQIVPNIQPIVGSLSCFIRSSSWVVGGFGQRFAGKNGSNFKYSEEQHEILRNDPKKYLAYRKKIESELNSRFRFILNGSKEQQDARDFAEKDMRSKLAPRPDLQDLIIPKDFAVGCRRPTPGNGYLEALCKENVNVVSSSIQEITPKGIKTADGTEHEFDIIVCATGFDVSWRPHYPTIGRNGVSLSEYWKETPNTYLSLTVANMPNYISKQSRNPPIEGICWLTLNQVFNGPFGPYGHGSFLPITEAVARYVMQLLQKMSEEETASFCPRQEAVNDFVEHRRKFLPRTAWTSPCRSWFKQGTVDGEPMMWPGSRIQFFETINTPRWEDYELKYTTTNRFGYWGNGFAVREQDGRDLSWYLGLLDGVDEQPALPDEDFEEFFMNK
ncbi:hypothetical protein COL922a_010641 [Colletotrichum nupharicola]|nr:hypothetical protein COL922a_010641 [Colletotrichum nupharicola]